MFNLMPTEIYDLVWNHPPLPAEALLAKVASPHARRTYTEVIELFYWRIERDPCQATPPGIAEYRGVLLNRYPPRTAALHLRIVSELYDEGIAAGIVKENPVLAVPPILFSPEPPVQVPTREVAERRLPTCRCDMEAGRRERALCFVVYGTAIRPEEVAPLQLADYRQEEGRARLSLRLGDGRRAAPMGLRPEAAEALDAYLAGRAVADDSPLFRLPRCRSDGLCRVARAARPPAGRHVLPRRGRRPAGLLRARPEQRLK